MNQAKDTILALSTPQAKSALALIRISGPHSYGLVKEISSNMPIHPNTTSFNELKTKDGLIIDQSLTTFFRAPKSFTGEDVVELSVHGGGAVIKKIIEILLKNKDARLAKPGEFTRRAFENNKLDLTQVEAIADIISAETEMQRKQAISHLSGNFFKISKNIFNNLKKILANVEAIIDFSDEDLPENLIIEIKEQIENSINEMKKMLKNSSTGLSIRSGFLITIMGKPNTGKSSFINNVSGRDVAIVTDQPGTTRDLIESFVDINGYPIRFVDTAGIRKSKDVVEKIGVEKALLTSKESDINIVFIENIKDINEFNDIKNAIYIKSKQDITKDRFEDRGFYNISSKNSYGINDLFNLITTKLSSETIGEKMFISRERHIRCIRSAIENLENSKINKNTDLFAEDIRLSLKSLSSLFGGVDIEDILAIIFSDFCIGK